MKGQGLSLNTIIIAALVLIVLVVLIVIFSGRMNLFGDAYDSSDDDATSRLCASHGAGGKCVGQDDTCPGSMLPGASNIDWIDCSNIQKCCYNAQ